MLIHSLIKKSAGERGDTMVEVLIAIAVVSLVLGGAYVTTNNSLQSARAAQERSIALKLAESQIEQIKGIAGDPTRSDLIFDGSAPNPFCISTGGDPVTDSHDDCKLGPDATHATVEPIFTIKVTRTGNNFLLEESWANVSGKTTDKLQLRYRAYE